MKLWIAALALTVLSHSVWAEVQVTDFNIREVLPGRSMTAGYLTVSNKNDKAVELTAVSSPMFDAIELHMSSQKDGMMHMEQLPSVTIAAGDTLRFQPGALHLMLFDVKASIAVGEKIPVSLTFKDGTTLEVLATISAIPTH